MKKIIIAIIVIAVIGYSCSKIKEVPEPVGGPVPYEQAGLRAVSEILDSVPDISIYRAAYSKSRVQHYIDSVREATGKTDAPFTLFVPKDAAWQAAGYTLSSVQALDAAACDQLIMYLTASGRLLPNYDAVPAGGNSVFPVILPGKFPFDLGGYVVEFDHFYSLHMAWAENAAFVNGMKIGTGKDVLAARDGVVYLADHLIKKPEHTVYELLAADTAYSFYLAALEKSNALYEQYKAGISPGDRNEEFFGSPAGPFYNYLSLLKTFNPNSRSADRFASAYIVFAPDNNAFRKAGIGSLEALEEHIEQSYITTAAYREMDHAIPRFTNMDSVLNYSFFTSRWTASPGWVIAFEYEQRIRNISGMLLYTNDMRSNRMLQQEGLVQTSKLDFYDWTTFDENTFEWATNVSETASRLLFIPEGDRIALKRGDAPGGRKAYIVPEHANVTALNGVIHRIDNLLLPTP